jgi:hypothetical protein
MTGLGILVFLVLPGFVLAQFRPGGNFDPNQYFDSLDKNKDGIVTRTEIESSFSRDRFDDIAKRFGITDGRITRDLWVKGSRQRDADRTFKDVDRNGDNKLDKNEVEQKTQTLKTERDKWDANKDSIIDLNEYYAFWEDLNKRRQPGNSSSSNSSSKPPSPPPFVPPRPPTPLPATTSTPATSAPAPMATQTAAATPMTPATGTEAPKTEPEKPAEPEKPPEQPTSAVFPSGRVPFGLPSWFMEYDGSTTIKKDNKADGQVALYEWPDSRTIKEFQEIDRNSDGFITVDEALRFGTK